MSTVLILLTIFFVSLLIQFLILSPHVESASQFIFYIFIGKKKINQIISLVEEMRFSHSNSKVEIISFTFYKDIIEGLQQLKYELGVSISEKLNFIISALQNESKVIENIKEAFLSSIVHFVIISFVTWVLLSFLVEMAEIEMSFFQYAVILSTQLVGLISFLLCFYSFYLRKTRGYGHVISTIYRIWLSWEAELSVNEIAQITSTLKPIGNKQELITQRVNELNSLVVKYGNSGEMKFDEIVDYTWYCFMNDLKSFFQLVERLKFFHIITFYLSSYFMVILFTVAKIQ